MAQVSFASASVEINEFKGESSKSVVSLRSMNLIVQKISRAEDSPISLLYTCFRRAYFDCSDGQCVALNPRLPSASALSGHLRLGPAERAGPGIFLPGSLHGSVLQCNQKAVGALLLLFPARVCKFSLGKAVPEPLFLLEPQLRAPTQRAQAPRTGVG